MQHPEAKSLGTDGEPCKADTRGLLGRSHIIAGRNRQISKEHDRRWEEGDDLESLLFKPIEFEPPGSEQKTNELAQASDRLIRRIKKIGIRALVKGGLGRRILEKICRRELVPVVTLRGYERRIHSLAH